ncbi:MAG: guanylate kinase [Bacteroidota bacterium]|jgi:guanylate kinase|nr:guanylate kinase [Bacteroidota bacterium]
MLFALSAPSGAGKTTIARNILRQFPALRFSISATTRTRRPREVEGKDYFFLTREDFESRIAAGGLVEWEEIYGNLYGTLRSEIDRVRAEAGHMLFDIDVKGALSIKRLYGDEAVTIFIQPPSLAALRQRLEHRGTDDADVIARRMQRAAWELDQARQFDHIVLNDDLARSIPAVADLITPHLTAPRP